MSKVEKILKKVYDLIDDGNLASAETQVSSLPADLDDAQAARSLILLGKGKRVEAAAIAEALVDKDFVLNKASGYSIDAVAHVLQQVSSHKHLVKAYEQTLGMLNPNSPSSTPLQSNLFNALVMAGDFASAQKLGMTLYKKNKEEAYLIRSIMCNLCLLRTETDPEALLMKITLRQLEGLVDKSSVAPEVAGMYLSVLRKTDSLKAIEWLCGSQGGLVGLPSTRYQMLFQMAAAQEGGLPRLRNIVARCAWEGDSDNWNFFTEYLNTLAASGAAAAAPAEVQFSLNSILGLKSGASAPLANSIEDVIPLCKALQAIELSREDRGKMRRGPFLAELVASKGRPECAALLKTYVSLFGRKGCCFLDVAMVCADITDIASVVDELVAVCEQQESLDPVVGRSYYLLGRKLPMLKWVAGEAIPDAEKLMVCDVSAHRKKASEFEGLEWSEEGPVDGLLITAANVAAREAMRATDPAEERSWLLRGLQCFAGMDRRKNNPGALVLAGLMSQRLGLGSSADFEQLDFKSIQFVTMGHVGFWPQISSRLFTNVRTHCEHAARYFGSLQRESDALKWKVFQHCTWSKTHEIDAFEAKLLRSLPRRELTLVQTLLHVKSCSTQKLIIEHIRSSLDKFAKMENLALVDSVKEATILAEDDMFLTAFLIDKPNSASSKSVSDYLFNKVDKDRRCAVVALCASAYAVIYDVAGVEAAKQIKVPKGAPPATVDSLLEKWGVTGATIADAGARSKGALGPVDWSPIISAFFDLATARIAKTDLVGPAESIISALKALGVALEALTPADAAWGLLFPFGWFLSGLLAILPPSLTTRPISVALSEVLGAVGGRLNDQIAAAEKAEDLARFLEVIGQPATPLDGIAATDLLNEIKANFVNSAKAIQAEHKEILTEVSLNLRRKK